MVRLYKHPQRKFITLARYKIASYVKLKEDDCYFQGAVHKGCLHKIAKNLPHHLVRKCPHWTNPSPLTADVLYGRRVTPYSGHKFGPWSEPGQ